MPCIQYLTAFVVFPPFNVFSKNGHRYYSKHALYAVQARLAQHALWIGKADGFISSSPYLVTDTFKKGCCLFQINAAFLCEILLQIWRQGV